MDIVVSSWWGWHRWRKNPEEKGVENAWESVPSRLEIEKETHRKNEKEKRWRGIGCKNKACEGRPLNKRETISSTRKRGSLVCPSRTEVIP